jgi:hypothetical protein
MESEYSSKGQGALGVTLGAIGTGLGILNGAGGLLPGLMGWGNQQGYGYGGQMPYGMPYAMPYGHACGQQYVSKDTYDVQNKLIEAERSNALLAAELNTEKKMVEVFNAATARINAVERDLSQQIFCLEKKVDDQAAAQAVINCGFNSAINLLQSQAAQFMGLTKTVIPNTSVCPGWGEVAVSIVPATTPTTGA